MAIADVTLVVAANGKVGIEGNACGIVLVNAGEEADTELLAKHGIRFDSKGKLTGYSTDPIPVSFPGLEEAHAQFDQVVDQPDDSGTEPPKAPEPAADKGKDEDKDKGAK